ncbi:molybdenum cofactor guanylyltransferase MobA [Arenicella xantha]|uniref:Molybdenum cofactor guanylyltransferase n=1 Tax=Arenicella xantha TaxID=644221 RepID=A0A395JP64_9GAMM|nr:molybdenum cofactor guanylyltransferase MobA [Arenicella xantha]RBP51358.1 molybdopterin-guanine dinucleotide biosynthesis protein A [Arenicella xantha]
MNLHQESVAAVILAGGAGTRMSGADKGLKTHQGRCLVESVCNIVAPQVNDLVVSANRNLAAYQALGFDVVTDSQSNQYQGPLAGVLSAIEHYQASPEVQALLVCPCDTPNIPVELAQRLIKTINSLAAGADCASAVAHDGTRQQSLHCLISRPDWQQLRDYLTANGRAVHRWHKKVGTIEVDFSDMADQFININRLEELAP